MLTQTDTRAQQVLENVSWKILAPIPDPTGYAGSFAGLSHGSLLVVGGANFPDGGAPWTGSVKKWTNKVFVLDSVSGEWRNAGQLPSPIGYGGSVSFNDQLIIIGGSNEQGHSSQVNCLEWRENELRTRRLPDLPFPVANMPAVLLNGFVYVAGGICTPDARVTENHFLRLSLGHPEKGWEILPSWPGPSRMLSVLGTDEDKLYLFSGVQLVDGARIYLHDAYCFDPDKGWRQVAALPASIAAAPSPALLADGKILVVGGDDGLLAAQASTLKKNHPGFSNRVLVYDPANDTWATSGKVDTTQGPDPVNLPGEGMWCPVTTTAVRWNDYYVLPGGEIRPAVRTNRVLAYKIND